MIVESNRLFSRGVVIGRVLCVGLMGAVVLGGGVVKAQQGAGAGYLDTSLSPEVRARDLVGKMTLEEKASQLVNQSRAIPRLKVPAYDWWSESLHGVAVNGTTEFPEPIGLAATFDAPAIHTMAAAIGMEGRVVHAQAMQDGGSAIFHGLDFWAPNVNIFRDPRWGRGQETYGEDPFLTGRMGVAFVTGMQGDDPKYYRVISTPKHFDVHSGPEPTRHFADVDVSRHDEVDTYRAGFRAAVIEGKAGSVMCAYNAINGEPACANEYSACRISCAGSGDSRDMWFLTAGRCGISSADITTGRRRRRLRRSRWSAGWITSAWISLRW